MPLTVEQAQAAERTVTVQALVRRLGALPMAEAEKVLRGLDPDFVRDVLRMLVAGMDPDSRKRLALAARRMESERVPADDAELWDFVRDECGLRVPRNAVCEGHCSPFEFMADVYFSRGNTDKLAVGNRGSGKTQIMGTLHGVNGRTKKRYTSATVGATEAQSFRCYGFFRELLTSERWRKLVRGKMNMGKTEFEHGGQVEIVVGTVTGVNSPHPVLAHFDEVELLRPGVYDEALNMAQGKNGYRAMNVLTSSWKKPKGFVSQLVDEATEAARQGSLPPYQLYRWCVWETTERCDADCSACPFADVRKGEWEDGSPRTFESACKRGSPEQGTGKLKHTDGFVSVEDAVGRFRKLPRRVWDAQQESRRPTMEGLIYDVFDEDRHTVERWDPLPENGDVVVGLDFGGSVPHAAGFWQFLDHDVRVGAKLVPRGAGVRFDEVDVKDVGNVEFGRLVNRKVDAWQAEHPGFRVVSFFGDPAAKAAREDFRALSRHGAGDDVVVRYRGHVDVDPRIALVYERMALDLVYVDSVRCPEWMEEVSGYERNPNTGRPYKEDDHHMDETGYVFWNRHVDSRRDRGPGQIPRAAHRPRAVRTRGDERVWDPLALAEVGEPRAAPSEGDPSPLVAFAPRRRRGPF